MSARATEVGRKLFPPAEAELIAELIRRDLPYYDATISRTFVAGMNQFARDVGILKGDVPYERSSPTQFSQFWKLGWRVKLCRQAEHLSRRVIARGDGRNARASHPQSLAPRPAAD